MVCLRGESGERFLQLHHGRGIGPVNQERRQPAQLRHGTGRPGVADDRKRLVGDRAGVLGLTTGRVGDGQSGEIQAPVTLVLGWPGRQAPLEDGDRLLRLAEQQPAVPGLGLGLGLGLDVAWRAVAG